MDSDRHEAGPIDFGSECDLHHFHPRDTPAVIGEFIQQAHARGLRRIRIVHGKGKSVKKQEVIKILADHPLVEGYGNDGPNWGATIVVLKE